MKILQIGVEKSGNYWLYNNLDKTAKAAGLPWRRYARSHPIYPLHQTWPDLSFPDQPDIDFLNITPDKVFYYIPLIFFWPIEDLDDFAAKTTHAWTHSNWFGPTSAAVFERFDKVVYIIRDPRDVLLSFCHFQFMPFVQRYSMVDLSEDPISYLDKAWLLRTQYWITHVSQHLAQRERFNIHFVCYERLRYDFQSEYRRLLDYLEISLSDAQIDQIADDVSVRTMKAASPAHVRSGKSGGWSESLSDTMKADITDMAEPLLELLGYPLDDAPRDWSDPSSLPRVPDQIDNEALAEITEEALEVPIDYAISQTVEQARWFANIPAIRGGGVLGREVDKLVASLEAFAELTRAESDLEEGVE
ncbi:MAG: sulfotransferase domain-containing protein [Myxococcales bacterium]|nr:sulfotransferase domain-containing protein [Myxococcales bacterium]